MTVRAEATYNYYGYVYDSDTRQPLAGVKVELWVAKLPDPTHGTLKDYDYTNSQGYYGYLTWTTWGLGVYAVFVHYTKAGYLPKWWEVPYMDLPYPTARLPNVYLRETPGGPGG